MSSDSDLTVLAERLNEFTRETKAHVCQHEKRDMLPILVPHRDGEAMAVVHLNQVNAGVMLGATRFARFGFEPEAMGLAFEGYIAGVGHEGGISPLTGRDWEPGEMQELAEKHDGLRKGWVVECMMTLIVDSAGDYLWSSLPYQVSESFGAPQVTWLDPIPEEDAREVQEVTVINLVRAIMLGTVPSPLPAGWPSTRSAQDAATATVLQDNGHVVKIWADEQTRNDFQRIAHMKRMANPN